MVTCTTPPFRAAVRLNSGVSHQVRTLAACILFLLTSCGSGPEEALLLDLQQLLASPCLVSSKPLQHPAPRQTIVACPGNDLVAIYRQEMGSSPKPLSLTASITPTPSTPVIHIGMLEDQVAKRLGLPAAIYDAPKHGYVTWEYHYTRLPRFSVGIKNGRVFYTEWVLIQADG